MKDITPQTELSGSLRSFKLSARPTPADELVRLQLGFPLVLTAALPDVSLAAWLRANPAWLQAQLLSTGAVLFRGFKIDTVEKFSAFNQAAFGELLEYKFRASPRSQVASRIYTSTDYPAHQPIFPHNEHSFSPMFPLKLSFGCIKPADKLGGTPIGSTRAVLKAIPVEIVRRFQAKGILYQRNYGEGFGLPWQVVFQTEAPQDVETYCRAHDIEFEWTKTGLRTRNRGPALARHPHSGESIWFNHATFFHVSTLPDEIRDGMLSQFQEEEFPNHTYYGDGSPIESDVLAELRAAYQQSLTTFAWETGDVLALDNMLAVHAREPYEGPRRILVGMSEPIALRDVLLHATAT